MVTLRRTRLRRMLAALGATGALGLAIALPSASARAQGATPDTRPTVAVIDFSNGAIGRQNDDMEPLRAGIAGMLITEMAGNQAIRVVEREQLKAVMSELQLGQSAQVDPGAAVRLGKLLNAHHIVTGGFVTDAKGRMVLTARSIETETGRIEYTTKVNGKTEDVLEAVEKLAEKVNAGLKLPALAVRNAREAGNVAPSAGKKQVVPFQAVMLYSRALQAMDKQNRDEAVQLFRASLAQFPDYEAAKQQLLRLESGATASTKPGA
jgi:TolB-like protein